MGEDTKAMVSTEDLHKVYPMSGKTVNVLRGVEFSVQKGEMVAVEGSSGVGKSMDKI